MMMKNCSRTVTEEKIEETDMRWKQSLSVERDLFPVQNFSSDGAEERGQEQKDSFWIGRKGWGGKGGYDAQNAKIAYIRSIDWKCLKMLKNAEKEKNKKMFKNS